METFIEQKAKLKREIERLELEICRLYDEIDQNELKMISLQKTLAEVGIEAE